MLVEYELAIGSRDPVEQVSATHFTVHLVFFGPPVPKSVSNRARILFVVYPLRLEMGEKYHISQNKMVDNDSVLGYLYSSMARPSCLSPFFSTWILFSER